MKKICLIGIFVSIFFGTFAQDITGRYRGTLTIRYHENARPEVKPQSIVRVEKESDTTFVIIVSDMSFGNIKIQNFTMDTIETLPSKEKNTTTFIRYKIKDMRIPRGSDGTFFPVQAMLKSGTVVGNTLELEIWANTGLGLSLIVRFKGNKIQ